MGRRWVRRENGKCLGCGKELEEEMVYCPKFVKWQYVEKSNDIESQA